MSQLKQMIIMFSLFFLIQKNCGANLDEKYQSLLDLSYKTPVVDFNETGYKHFVLNPTSYDIVIFYTSSKCDFCDTIYKEYQKVQASYFSENSQTEFDQTKDQKPVFFGRLLFSQTTQQYFFDLDFKSVPNLAIFDGSLATVNQKDKQHYLSRRIWKVSPTDGHVTVSKIMEFVNKRTNRNIEYKEPLINVLSTIFIIVAVFATLLKVFFTFKPFFMKPSVQYKLAIIIYFVCMSGIVYNIIHNIPWTYVDNKGVFHWMADIEGQGGRDQLGLEGVIMSGSITLAGVLIVITIYLSKNHSIPYTLRMGLCLICLIISYFLTRFIEGIYKKKSWYDIRFYPPQHYIKGPLKRDQGISI